MLNEEKIELLIEALNNLVQSVDSYMEHKDWIDQLTFDLLHARSVLIRIPPKSWNIELPEELK